jgi:hypothetical protein
VSEVTNITSIHECQLLDVMNAAMMAFVVSVANLVTMRLLGRNVDNLSSSDDGLLSLNTILSIS